MKSVMARAFAAAVLATGVLMPSAVDAKETATEIGTIYVDKDIVIGVDVSGTMDELELVETVMPGIVDHFLSDEAAFGYQSGQCNALTMVYYAAEAYIAPTIIVCSVDDAKRVEESFVRRTGYNARWGVDLSNGFSLNSQTTTVSEGLRAAGIVFADRDGERKIESNERVVILTGDEFLEWDQIPALEQAAELTVGHGARICAMPLEENGILANRLEILATEQMVIVEGDGVSYPVIVRPCQAQRAGGPDDVRDGLASFLRTPGT